MLKVHEWLVYIIMKPCKSFQHLINCLAKQNKCQKKTEKEIRKEFRNTYLAPRRKRPSQPTRPRHRAVFFLVPGRLLPPWRACRRFLATSCFAWPGPLLYLLATPPSGDAQAILPLVHTLLLPLRRR